MVKIKTIKNYYDIEMEKQIQVGFIHEVSPERARVLLSLGLVEILSMDKLKKKEKII